MDRIELMSMYVRIVETGSLSAVAKELKTSQPTVSKRLEHLEKHLKVRLLARNTHGVRPTEAGQRYYEASKKLVADVGQLEASVVRERGHVGGRLRLNFPVSFGQQALTSIVCAFHEVHPEICVDLTLTDRLVDLVEDAVDVALRFNGVNDSSVIARPLGQFDAVLIATPAYLKKHGTPRTPEQLGGHTFLRYDSSDVETLYGPGDATSKVQVNAWLALDNSSALKQAVLFGAGIGRMGRALVHRELQSGELVHVLPGWRPALDTVYALYLPTRFQPEKIKAFVAFLTEAIKAVPGWSAQERADFG
jgi:DNA-binding transcriptional LysR family regulator